MKKQLLFFFSFLVIGHYSSAEITWSTNPTIPVFETPYWGALYSKNFMNTHLMVSPIPNIVDIATLATGKLNLDNSPSEVVGQTLKYSINFSEDEPDIEDSIDVVVNSSLSVKEVKQELSLNVSPNPASEVLNINLSGAENATIKMVDVLGNVVYREVSFNQLKKIDVSNFKNGVYFIMIDVNGSKPITRKIIIRH